MKTVFVLVLLVYIGLGFLIAYISRRFFGGGLREYYVAGGRVGALVAAGTYAATTYSAFMMIGLVGMTYATGVGALGFELTYLMSTVLLLSTVGVEIWRLSRERQWLSPAQMLGDLYGSRTLAVAVSLVYMVAMLPYIAAQIQGLNAVFQYGGLDKTSALVISTVLVYAWIAVAGMWSVALTDTYQGFFMLFGGLSYLVWTLAYLVPSTGSSIGSLIEALGDRGLLGLSSFWTLSVFLAYTTPWVFFAVTNPQVVVRLYIPRDESSYRRAVAYFSLYGLLYTLIVVTVGLAAGGLALLGHIPRGMRWDSVTPYLLGLMDPLLGSVIGVSVIAAAVSTANSIVLAVSSTVVRDLLGSWRLSVARAVDAVLVAAAALLAYQELGFIVEMSVITSVILLPLAPLTILGVYRHRSVGRLTRASSLVSLATGFGIAMWYAVSLGPRRAFTETVSGLPVSLWVLLISTIVLLTGHLMDVLQARGLYRRESSQRGSHE